MDSKIKCFLRDQQHCMSSQWCVSFLRCKFYFFVRERFVFRKIIEIWKIEKKYYQEMTIVNILVCLPSFSFHGKKARNLQHLFTPPPPFQTHYVLNILSPSDFLAHFLDLPSPKGYFQSILFFSRILFYCISFF